LNGAILDVLAPGSAPTRARIDSVLTDSTGRCAPWPAVHLVGVDAQPVNAAWQVAFPPGRVTALPVDSLPALSHADSTRLTIRVAHLASTAPGDTATVFRGRPYVVRQAHRFQLTDGRQVVVAEVARVVNQEANPLQEELVLIAETDVAAPTAGLSLAFADRQIGLEEVVESFDLLAALQMRNGVSAVLVRREIGDGFRLVLIEREGPGKWRLRWRSAYASC
jgi:hypothetical protein